MEFGRGGPSAGRTGGRRRIAAWAVLLVLGWIALGCSTDSTARIRSIYELKRQPTPENVEKIRQMLVDSDRDVRATALNALVGLDVEDAGTLARAGLADEDDFVRATAAKLLGDLGDPAVAELLAARVREDAHPIVR